MQNSDTMEQEIRAGLEWLATEKDTMCGMMALRFESCDEKARTLSVSMAAEPWMTNPLGVMHGGLVASALDSAMGSLSSWCVGGGGRTPTVTMQTTYIRPVPLSGRVFLKSKLISAGKTLNHLSAELWAEGDEGRTLATATGSYFAARR